MGAFEHNVEEEEEVKKPRKMIKVPTTLASIESLTFPLVHEVILLADYRCKKCQDRVADIVSRFNVMSFLDYIHSKAKNAAFVPNVNVAENDIDREPTFENLEVAAEQVPRVREAPARCSNQVSDVADEAPSVFSRPADIIVTGSKKRSITKGGCSSPPPKPLKQSKKKNYQKEILITDPESMVKGDVYYPPGKGKGKGAVEKLLSGSKKMKAIGSVVSESSDEAVDVEEKSFGEIASLNFTHSPLHSSEITPVDLDPKKKFRPKFKFIPVGCGLDTVSERADYVSHIMVPRRVSEMKSMSNEILEDYNNDSLIRLIESNVEQSRRVGLLNQDVLKLKNVIDRLKGESSKKDEVTSKTGKTSGSADTNKLRDMQKEILLLRGKMDSLKDKELEWKELKKTTDTLVVSKNDEIDKLQRELVALREGKDFAEKKAADTLALLEDTLKKNAELVDDRSRLERLLGEATSEVIGIRLDRKKLICEVLPHAFHRLLKSYEFAVAMGEVQGCAVKYGEMLMLDRVRSQFELDVSILGPFNPDVEKELRVVGEKFENMSFPYVEDIASNPERTADEMLLVDPQPFPK